MTDTRELVERLAALSDHPDTHAQDRRLLRDAADTITALSERCRVLEDALKAQDDASANAAALSNITLPGETIPKHLMDHAEGLFAKAERLRRAALTSGGRG